MIIEPAAARDEGLTRVDLPYPDPVLPGDVPRMADETLIDWLFRAGALHGYRSPDVMAGLVGGAFPDVAMDPRYEAKLSKLLSADITEIRKGAVRRFSDGLGSSQGRVIFFGHSLLAPQLRTAAQWFCPLCLAEEPYLRNTWALAMCAVCHRHGCQLVDRCPACENRLQYNRRKIEYCRCGYDLRWIQPSAASQESARLWRYIDNVLNGRVEQNHVSYTGEIRKLSLDGLLALVPILAAIKSNADRAPSLTMMLARAGQYSSDELGIVSHTAAELLQDWPTRLEAHILRGLEVLPRGAAILESATGSITALSGWVLPDELAFLDRIVKRCASSRWESFLRQTRVAGRAPGSQRGVEAIARQENSTGPTEAATPEYDGTIPIRDAAALLGMESRDIMQIFQSWHLKPPVRGRPVSPRVVSQRAVSAWRSIIESRYSPWVDTPLDQFRRFHEAKIVCSHLAITTSMLLGEIESGQIRICLPPGQRFNLERAYLNERDLIEWWQDSAAKSGLEDIRAAAARRIVGVGDATLERLVTKGALPLDPKTAKGACRVATRRVLESMGALKILRRIEEFCGVRASDLQHKLEQAGITLLTGQGVEAQRRRELRTADVSALHHSGILDFLRQSAREKWAIDSTRSAPR